MSRLGSRPTGRELQLFHAWVQHGSSGAAGPAMGCSEQNILLALARLRGRLGVRHSIQLVRPLVMSPLYGRIRTLERENRRLREIVRQQTGPLELDHRRITDGGLSTKRQRRRWRKSRQMARDLGLPVATVARPAKNEQHE